MIQSTLPPVLPKSIRDLSRSAFGDLLTQQRLRLRKSWSEQDLVDLELEFKAFKDRLNVETGFKDQVEAMPDTISFDDAWESVGTTYPLMCTFFGGLASVFPGTSTVESDFSIIGFEKDDYRRSLTNFSLEGVLQCKQHKKLRAIEKLIS